MKKKESTTPVAESAAVRAALSESFARLWTAVVAADKSVITHADLGRLLNVSPQTITNWITRGVSRDGLLMVERRLGIAASFIQHGDSPSRASSNGLDDLSKATETALHRCLVAGVLSRAEILALLNELEKCSERVDARSVGVISPTK